MIIFADLNALYDEAARSFVAAVQAAVAERGRCLAVLTGGSTIPPVYERLASRAFAAEVDWAKVDVFWSDERFVAPDDPLSNYKRARETLLDHVPVPPDRVHRMPGEEPDRDAAAATYEREILGVVAESGRAAADELRGTRSVAPVRFDFAFLGLGSDGHVASLFPRSRLLDEHERWAAAVRADRFPVPDPSIDRLTLTPRALNQIRQVVFVVTGTPKAHVLRAVLEGPRDVSAVPAQVVAPPDGVVTWLVDEAAAAKLRR